MTNVKMFFCWIAGIPDLWEQFLLVMQEVSPNDTEKMYKNLAAFAIEHGFDRAADEMMKFYQQEAQRKMMFASGV